MCGICGIFGSPEFDTLAKMVRVLAHRGPDDEYIVGGEHFCIGARRLSIIDLEGGRQPLSNEDGTIWVAQNGEIYNFPLLMEGLLSKGHTFRSRSDTEVIAHLYEEKGDECVQSLSGMYAIAIWDDKRKEGLLIRDRVGKKPLYYLTRGDKLYFASEIKSLLQIPDFSKRINYEALYHYFSYKNTPCPLTIFQDIFMLPPATALHFEPGKSIRLNKYWQPDFSDADAKPSISEEETVDELISVLKVAVSRRLISDVPIGFFLSGGLDSGLITALAAEIAGKKINTFTLTYAGDDTLPGKQLDRDNARKISQIYGTDHHEEMVDFPNFPDEFPKIIMSFDEPFFGVISTYFLSRLISRHVKTRNTGDGSDELFGSYLSHRLAFPVYNYIQFKNTGDTKYQDFQFFQNDMGYLAGIAEHQDWKWRYKLLVFSDEEKRKLLAPEMVERTRNYDTGRHLEKYFQNLTATDPLNRMLEAEFRFQLPDQVLAFSDRLSMAHSLELRTAYLDKEFVELAARIPGKLKIRDGETKYILKKAASQYLPHNIVYRKKEGFVMPVTEWLYYNLGGYVRDILSQQSLACHNLFNYTYVQGLIDKFYSQDYDYRLGNKLLSLIAFHVWHDLYMKNGQ